MTDWEKVKTELPGCEEVLCEMAEVQASLDTITADREGLEKQLKDKRTELEKAREAKAAADRRDDRQAWEAAWDRAAKLRGECELLESRLTQISSGELKARYEALRPKVYSLEEEAAEKLEQAKQVVENRRKLRGPLTYLATQIQKL